MSCLLETLEDATVGLLRLSDDGRRNAEIGLNLGRGRRWLTVNLLDIYVEPSDVVVKLALGHSCQPPIVVFLRELNLHPLVFHFIKWSFLTLMKFGLTLMKFGFHRNR